MLIFSLQVPVIRPTIRAWLPLVLLYIDTIAKTESQIVATSYSITSRAVVKSIVLDHCVAERSKV